MAKKKEPQPQSGPVSLDGLSEQEIYEGLKKQGYTAKDIEYAGEVLLARQLDDPIGFASFYWLVTGNKLPEHAREWVEEIYAAKKESRGVVVEAFRGSTKTTTVTIAFTAFRIGKEPHRANLLIQVGDDIAQDNASQVADIILNNPGFKAVFPNIEADREAGWGANGYEVKRTDISYQQWRQMNAKRKDPTLIGLGYKSRGLIGKHPDGVCAIDDINDENNTSSSRELENVKNILTGTIFPMFVPETWQIFIGTPWVENDALNYVASTGEYLHLKTPVYEVDASSETEFEGQNIRLAWQDRFPVKEIAKAKKIAGTLQFARMFLLDLTAAKGRIFRYHTYPNSEVKVTWPVVGGVDYARVDAEKRAEGKSDYFAMAYVAKLPGGGACVIDGVLQRCTQAEAEGYIMRAQGMYPNWQKTAVESDGAGAEFIAVVRRNPGIKIQTVGTKKKAKSVRYRIMQPWLESGLVRVSDAETPFLVELRRELDNYPYVEHDDALDALFWALMMIPDVLNVMAIRDENGEEIVDWVRNTKQGYDYRKHPAYAMAQGRK